MKNIVNKNSIGLLFAILVAGSTVAGEEYPVAISQRPGSLPFGSVEGALDFSTKPVAAQIDPTFGTKVKLGVGGGFQLNLGYDGLNVGNFDASKTVAHVGTRRSLFSAGNYSMSANADLPLYFDGQTVKNMTFGVSNSYSFTDAVSVSALGKKFLDVKFGKKLNLEVNAPVALSFQANENIYLELETKLASASFRKFSEATYIWNETPVDLSVTYAFNNVVDLSVNGGYKRNWTKAENEFTAGVGVAFRAGNLLG